MVKAESVRYHVHTFEAGETTCSVVGCWVPKFAVAHRFSKNSVVACLNEGCWVHHDDPEEILSLPCPVSIHTRAQIQDKIIEELPDLDLQEDTLKPKELTVDRLFGSYGETTQHDPVNSPSHYITGEIECIDGIRAALGLEGFQAFCRGNSIKYLWRAGQKGDFAEDLQKSVWYTRMATGDDPRKDK